MILKGPISTKKLSAFHERALAIAKQSHDPDTQVAALLINSDTLSVSSDGYNGYIRQAPDHKLPNQRPEKYDYMIHAEANLLCNAVRNGVKTDNCIIYTTHSPCKQCLRLLWQAGIKEFYFKEKYRDFDVCTNMLDIEIEHLKEEGGFFRMVITTRK